MKRYKRELNETELSKKLIDEIYIDSNNSNQLKVKRKEKVILIKLEGNSTEKNSFRDYLLAMTDRINNNDYDSVKEKENIIIDLPPIHVTNIPDRFSQQLLNIFKDVNTVTLSDSPEYKKKAIEIYKQNS